MEQIISKVFQLIKDTENLTAFEEHMQLLMRETFSHIFEKVLEQLDRTIVKEKQKTGWAVQRIDHKDIQFTFGPVRLCHTLMWDKEGQPAYPLDEWLGLRKYQRYSSLVEVKAAELASRSTYRETARVLREWTAVTMSHQTVGSLLRRVGEAQGRSDADQVAGLGEAAELPEGKRVGYLMAEADGVFVRSTERKKSIEVRHAITYEGWNKNGKRVSLDHPSVIMTTQPSGDFWDQVQAVTASRYSLEDTQVVTNSDGGQGYTADKFEEAFSQSRYPVHNQLDAYHISQALNRTFGVKSEWKGKVKTAIDAHDSDSFKKWLDTYESTLEDDKGEQKLQAFRTYIEGNWNRIKDWREEVRNPPQQARGLGAMESNQRHVSFRMKKRGMHWSPDGAEAMVKVKQGMLNGTLREVYLKHQRRSTRQQRAVKKTAALAQYLHWKTRPSIGARNGRISLHAAHSTAMGQFVKCFR